MTLDAGKCSCGHLSCPPHPHCPDCGSRELTTLDLSEHDGEVVTWTRVTATAPNVPDPNMLAIVEFEVDDGTVRTIGQVASDEIEIGDVVSPTYEPQLRDPDGGIIDAESQDWDGYRFVPAE